MIIELNDLPKISLNKFFGRMHWTKRKQIVDNYHWIIKSQFKDVLSKDNVYRVKYSFEFKRIPLDASNCVAALKLIEDVIFEDDSYKIVEEISITSRKGIKDKVTITIKEV